MSSPPSQTRPILGHLFPDGSGHVEALGPRDRENAVQQTPCQKCGKKGYCWHKMTEYFESEGTDSSDSGYTVPLWCKIAWILFSVAAAYLSWTCNASEPVAIRMLYAFVAAIFGWVYLLYYFFFRSDFCRNALK